MIITTSYNNNPTFGITQNKAQCKKVLEGLKPEIKEQLDIAINRFCDITQRNGVKGTFCPVGIKQVKENMVLEYQIMELHNNGGDKIFKCKQSEYRNNGTQRDSFTIKDEIVLRKKSANAYLDGFLSKVRNVLNKQQH